MFLEPPTRRAASNPLRVAQAPATSLAQVHSAEHAALIASWVECAISTNCPFVMALSAPRESHLSVLFAQKQPATLRRHLNGWMSWASYAVGVGICVHSPSVAEIQDFVRNLVEGSQEDRGPRAERRSQAPTIVKAMRFAGRLLEMQGLLDTLGNQLVHAWLLRHAENTRSGALGRCRASE